ncbi:MAG: GatB/YqeY domain-containing protein [Arenicellales bacterium]|nr:GatB/YqeY domain-containing protein [Arenicellales bacterium]
MGLATSLTCPSRMTLKDRIAADMKAAMRARESERLEFIRMLRAAIQRREVDDRKELEEEEVLAVTQKLLKQSQDAASQFIDGGREDLAAKEERNIALLQEYLPEPLLDEEIDALISEAISATGALSPKEMGKVIGWLKPKVQGRADMGKISASVKNRLQ